jgi:hypothetical protein
MHGVQLFRGQGLNTPWHFKISKGSKKVPKDVRWPETKCNGVDTKYADKIRLT